MTLTRTQQKQQAGQTTQQGETSTSNSSEVPSQTPPQTATPFTMDDCTSPDDILNLVTANTSTISEEGKTIVSTIVKAMQIIINQKDQTIEKLQNHIFLLDNRVTELESQLDELSQYERRDTVILSGPALPKEELHENCVDLFVKSVKDNLHLNIEHKDVNVAHRLGTKKTQTTNRPIIVKLQSRQHKYEIMNACITVKPNIYINESLTPKRRLLFKKVWDIRKQHRDLFQQCYTHDGKIYVKLKQSNQKQIINSDASLAEFLDKYPILK